MQVIERARSVSQAPTVSIPSTSMGIAGPSHQGYAGHPHVQRYDRAHVIATSPQSNSTGSEYSNDHVNYDFTQLY